MPAIRAIPRNFHVGLRMVGMESYQGDSQSMRASLSTAEKLDREQYLHSHQRARARTNENRPRHAGNLSTLQQIHGSPPRQRVPPSAQRPAARWATCPSPPGSPLSPPASLSHLLAAPPSPGNLPRTSQGAAPVSGQPVRLHSRRPAWPRSTCPDAFPKPRRPKPACPNRLPAPAPTAAHPSSPPAAREVQRSLPQPARVAPTTPGHLVP
jgi:hypothetical protein